MEWVQHIREHYAPLHVPKPVSRQYIFDPDDVAEMHNLYMNSLEWMPPEVRCKYEQLRAEATESHDRSPPRKGKGKNKGKDTTTSVAKPGVKAHQLKKQTFNVCFFKAFGNKTLFWHLVKMGPENQDLQELLDVWAKVIGSPQYHALREASRKKSEDVAQTKR